MGTVGFDLLMTLAALCVLTLHIVSTGSSSPDAKIPLALMTIPPVIAVAIVLAVAVVRGVFPPVPISLWVLALGWCGVVASTWILLALSIDPHSGMWRPVAGAAVYLLLAACVVAIHGASGAIPPAIRMLATGFLGLIATGGLAVGGFGIWGIAVKGPEENRVAAEQIKLSEARWEFDHIEEGAPMWRYLGYIDSAEPTIRQKARERIANWPGRDEALAAEMHSWFREVASYIASAEAQPNAKLGPEFGRELVGSLEFWEHAFPGPLRRRKRRRYVTSCCPI